MKQEAPRDIWQWNPRLRVSEQMQAGEVVYVVQDPVSGDNFQIGELEYAVAQGFDGRRSLRDVRAFLAGSGDDFELVELEEFARQLLDAGLLILADRSAIDPASDRPVPLGVGRWSASRLLYLQIAAFNAESFFRRTLAGVRPLLGVPALAVAGVAVVVAMGILLGNWADIAAALASRLSASTLLAVWFWYGVVVLVHEMAHGYVCAHLGGRVQTLGVLIMYGKPCAYCDVSDAWLFPRKSHKIWVMAAGSLLELFLWAVATVVWRMTSPETWIHGIALILMTVCGVGTLFNFNPLLKYDGYYMLSDALEVPNLRQRAFQDIKARLLRRPREAASDREQRIFLWYGVFALLYSALFLSVVVFRLQDWMQAKWGGTGLLLFWSAITVAAARPLLRGAGGFWSALRRASMSRRVQWGLGGLALLAILGLVRWPLKVASECRIEPLERVIMRSPISAVIDTVLVEQGDQVSSGALLLELSRRDLEYELCAARAEESELLARLAILRKGAREEELAMARRRVDTASAQLAFELKAWERAQRSFETDLISRETVEDAERRVQLARDEEQSARQALDLLQAGSRPGEIQAMEARVAGVTADIQHLEEDLRRSQVFSPIGGKVLTPHLEQLVGRYVERGDSLFVLADLSHILLEIPVPEKDVGDVQLGARVRFKARSHPKRVFDGEVISIAPVADPSQRQRTVLVQSRIHNPDGILVADASGFAKIYCGDRSLGGLLARRGVRMLRTEFWALW
jgi:multidrug resistance efflux pump